MSTHPFRRRWLAWLAAVPVVAAVAMVPASASQGGDLSPAVLSRLSSPVVQRYLMAHPDQAAAGESDRMARADISPQAAHPSGAAASSAPTGLVRFNRDTTGLPQNEESVGACPRRPSTVLEGTNDYRGLINPVGNFTGWYLSTDGGRSVANEGLLPAVSLNGRPLASQGDPIDFATGNCDLYAAGLNFPPDVDLAFPPAHTNGAGIYRSTPRRLASCPGGDDPSCWPQRRLVVSNAKGHFIDKPWMYVGRSGSAGQVVWLTYTDFDMHAHNQAGFTASIHAVRCDARLRHCTDPMLISGSDRDVQFSDVTIGSDGRTYLTWIKVEGELTGTAETFTIKSRVAPAGSTDFGPARVVFVEKKAIPFDGLLHANDFRIATYPKSTVTMVNGHPREWVVWDACSNRVLDTVCEESRIKLRWSDDFGATWSPVQTVSLRNENYFPTIDADARNRGVAIAYYTNRFDPVFHNRQDVEMVNVGNNGTVSGRSRLTPFSNETEADPALGGSFIGDYIEIDALRGTAYVGFNANYVSMPLLGMGTPVPQQDNYLVRVR